MGVEVIQDHPWLRACGKWMSTNSRTKSVFGASFSHFHLAPALPGLKEHKGIAHALSSYS